MVVKVAWIVQEPPWFRVDKERSLWLRPCADAALRCRSRRCASSPRRATRVCAECEHAVCEDCECHSNFNHESSGGTCRCWFGNFGNSYHDQGPGQFYFGGALGGPAYAGPYLSEAQKLMEHHSVSQWRLEARRGEPTRSNAWYQPTVCAREGCGRYPTTRCARCKVTPYCSRACQKHAWVEEDAYGRTHRESCGPYVSYGGFAARGAAPGAVRPAAAPEALEDYRAAVGAYPLERGYVFAGRRVPPLRELCVRALPIGTELPPTSMQVDNGSEDQVVTQVETYHRTYSDCGSLCCARRCAPRVRVFETQAAAEAAAKVAGTEKVAEDRIRFKRYRLLEIGASPACDAASASRSLRSSWTTAASAVGLTCGARVRGARV